MVHSSLKKVCSRFTACSKGFSTVIGTTFMVLIMLLLSTGVFLWSLSRITDYNEAVKDKSQLEVDRLSEKVTASNVNYEVLKSTVLVEVKLKNEGPLPVQITTLWILDTTIKKYGFNNTLNLSLKPGEEIFCTGGKSIRVEIKGANSTDTFTSWFVTARGNIVNLEKGVIVAQLAQGIGSISFDFEKFWHYDFRSKPSDGTPLPPKSRNNYTISANNYTVFHVMLVNLDPLGEDIVLNGNSSIYIICAQRSTVKYGIWNLVNVTSNKIYPNSHAQYYLKYGVWTEVYFAGNPLTILNPDVNTAYPLNILLFGRKGNNDYGQNIPFVSIYLVS